MNKKNIIIAVICVIVVIAAAAGGFFLYLSSTTIGKDQAAQVALAHAGISLQDAAALRTELERDDGIWKYEVEFYYNYMEYTYEIEAQTGAVLTWEMDR